MCIEVQENETIEAFADQFYFEAQILMGCSALTTFDDKIALKYIVKLFNQLSIAMVQPLVNKCTIIDVVKILKKTGV